MYRYMLLLVLVLAACGGGSDGDSDVGATATREAERDELATARAEPAAPTARPTAPQTASFKVTYRITSDPPAVVSLTYQNATGGTAQEEGVVTPWDETFTMQAGDFAYVSAQGNEFAATIRCDILVDGATLASSSSSGAFVIASCDGTVGR